MLSRRVGLSCLQAAEDAVQEALVAAVDSWPREGLPDNPSAWLYRVAHNRLLGELRQLGRQGENEPESWEALGSESRPPTVQLRGEVEDDLLRMLFVCCSDALPSLSSCWR